jgi:hypothetical protein
MALRVKRPRREMGATDPADGGGSAGRIHQVGLGIGDDGAGVSKGHQIRERREMFPPGPALPITQEAWPPAGRRRAFVLRHEP